MGVVSWDGARVSTRAWIAVARPLTGARLRDAYLESVQAVTFGLARMRGNSIVLGPFTLLRFGTPKVTRNAVDWPIEGGLLAASSGGRWRVQASGGRVEATVNGYAPRLPRLIYSFTHLQVHQLFTRLYLLRLRGPEPAPGVPASAEDRLRAATVDTAFCLTLARLTGRRRPTRVLLVAAVYHVVCWSLWSRTLGGLVTRQRVVALDGSPLTPAQSLWRLLLLPTSWLTGRAMHDQLAGTAVIAD
jgi:hypothetical protein